MKDKITKSPHIRFVGFTDDWEQRKLEEEFYKVNERNDGSFGKEHWISVAKMYFQDPEKVQSNNIDTRTYVMRFGDIAFEGHPNQEFKFGRFVANDIGDGVVSELFPIYRHKHEYDNDFWKRAIQLERIMAPIFAKSITSSGNSSNKLNEKHFLRELIPVPAISEQKQIGTFFRNFDNLIDLHQRKLELLRVTKRNMLRKMFPQDGESIPEVRFEGFTDAWAHRKLKDISERIIVGLATSVTPYYRDSGVPLLRNMNIKENYLDDSDILFLEETYAKSNETKMIHENDVLTVHTGSNIGLTCIASKKYEGSLSFTTLITTPKKGILDSLFLMQYMNSSQGKKRVSAIVTAGGKPNLNSGDLENFVVIYPKIEEQQQIGAYFSNLDNLIILHQRELDLLKNLKKAMIQQMFI